MTNDVFIRYLKIYTFGFNPQIDGNNNKEKDTLIRYADGLCGVVDPLFECELDKASGKELWKGGFIDRLSDMVFFRNDIVLYQFPLVSNYYYGGEKTFVSYVQTLLFLFLTERIKINRG